MIKVYLLLIFSFITTCVYAGNIADVVAQDTNEVIALNKQAYSNYRDNPKQTIKYANEALSLAQKLNYIQGIAEANRLLGIANSSLYNDLQAIKYYLWALNYFKQINNLAGEAKVYNNIGNEYQEIDYDKSLSYFNKSLSIATKLHLNKLIAPLYLNMGNVYYRKKQFTLALSHYKNSEGIFTQLKDTIGLIQCWQNQGVIYFFSKDYPMAKKFLTYAHDQAKAHDLNKTIAEINLTLTSLYSAENDFDNALKMLNEGKSYTELVQSKKLVYDYLITSYELEYKRKNYKAALDYLRSIYVKDSTDFKSTTAVKLTLQQEQYRQQEQQRITELQLQRQSYNRYKFIAATIVAGLLLIVIVLLVGNVKRKADTNRRLTELNAEVNYQKDNLDRINHHLEEIIDERTKDLQDKNIKLSEYSSYLSHQIRGPIATLKGLLNLEKENLLSQRECLAMMDKCVTDIDEKIIGISEMLHDTENKTV